MKLFNVLKPKRLLAGLSLIALPITVCGASLAWFKDPNETPANLNSVVQGSYFESGIGTIDDPFEIASPRQLYYFAWLQDMGYFNSLDAESGSQSIKQYHFFVSNDLDMSGYTLPPVGTQDYPFVGSFTGVDPREGKDKTPHAISNLNITNDSDSRSYSDYPIFDDQGQPIPFFDEITGFFGVIGSLDESKTEVPARNETTGRPTGSYSYSTSALSVSDFYIDGITIQTKSENALIGIVAGYANGTVENVGIVKSNLNIKSGSKPLTDITSNISDYSAVGYVPESYRTRDVQIKENPGIPVEGDPEEVDADDLGNKWGGSIDMKTMYDNLNGIYNKGQSYRNGAFVDSETYIYDEVDPSRNSHSETTKALSGPPNSNYKIYKDNDLGSFYFYKSSNYTYLYGPNDSEQKKTVSTTTYKNTFYDAYYIYDENGHYLNINNNHTGITTGNSEANATKWIFEDNKLSTLIEEDLYYLNASLSGLTISSTPTTNWEELIVDSYHVFYTSFGNNTDQVNFFINYSNGWTVVPEVYFYISDGNNYLNLNGTNSITNGTSQASATKWYFSDNENHQGRLFGFYNNTLVYLYKNGSNLTASTNNSTNWTFNGEYISTGSDKIYLDGTWKVGTSGLRYGYYIKNTDGSITLGHSGTTINTSNTVWTFENYGGSSGKIYSTEGSTTYYLRISRSLFVLYFLEITTNSSEASNFDSRNNVLQDTSSKRYITFSSNQWTQSTSKYTVTFEQTTSQPDYGRIVKGAYAEPTLTKGTNVQVVTHKTEDKVSGYATYFPLAMNVAGTSYSTNLANTGYVVSGGFSDTYDLGRADIRVSSYGITNISNSYTQNADDFKSVRTINASGDHDLTASEIANLKRYNSTDSTKKDGSKDKLIEVIKNQSNVYGLHFMETEISMDHIIEADKVIFNGQTFTDDQGYGKFELPMDCIDFTLSTKGIINFFAGTYYSYRSSYNKSFFSLHKIFRDESGYKITDIKEINRIFEPDDPSDDYIYEYIKKNEDGSISTSWSNNDPDSPSKYNLVFNTAWIKTQSSLNNNYLYYFEIPANIGEYALGSTNSDGAYLLYLDISANKQTVYRTTTTTESTLTTDTYEFPKGVGFVNAVGDSVDPDGKDLVNYQLNGTYSTSNDGVDIGRENNEVTASPGSNITSTYVGQNVTANPPGEGNNPSPLIRNFKTSLELSQADSNITTGYGFRNAITVVDDVTTYSTGEEDVTRVITLSTNMTPKGSTNETTMMTFYTDSVADSVKFNFNYSFSAAENKYYIKILFDEDVNIYVTFFNTNYVFNINGADITIGDNPPTVDNPRKILINKQTEPFTSLISPRPDPNQNESNS